MRAVVKGWDVVLERWAVDDGNHVPVVEAEILTSAREGRDMVTVACACGRMRPVTVPSGSRLAPHVAHFAASQRISGPPWLPLGIRLVLLAVADLGLLLAAVAAGQATVPHPHGPAAYAGRLALVLAGMAAAAVLTVGVRRYIAPARLPRL